MPFVRMISGVYGYRPAGSKRVEAKRVGDPPFEVDDERAKRLVALGVAEVVCYGADEVFVEGVATGLQPREQMGEGSNLPDVNDLAGGEEDAPEIPEYSESMSLKELKAIMQEYDLPYKVGMSKADCVAALDKLFSDIEEDNSYEEEPNPETEADESGERSVPPQLNTDDSGIVV